MSVMVLILNAVLYVIALKIGRASCRERV